MKRAFLCLVVCLAAALPALAAEGGAAEKARPADEVRKEMDALRARMEKLEGEAAAAERREHEARELADIQQESRERLRHYEEHLRDLARARDDDRRPPARKALLAAVRAHVEAVRAIDAKIVALKGPEALAEARKLRDARADEDVKWDLVDRLKYERAAELDDMEHAAAETGSAKAKDLIAKLKRLHEEDVAAGEKELALRQTRADLRDKIDALRHDVWRAVEVERKPPEAERPPAE